jgi:ABC-type multidrug transport system fused ATPase/permease subunit
VDAAPVAYRQTFARLLGFLRPYKLSLAVSILLAAAPQAAQIAMIVLTGAVINRVKAQDRHGLEVLIAAIVVIGLAKALFMVGRRFISGRQALGVEYDMRNRLYSHLLRLSFGFYDRHQTGQLMSRATVDLQGVRFFLGYGLIFFFQHVITLVGVTGVMFWYDWRLALIALAITPVLIGLDYR